MFLVVGVSLVQYSEEKLISFSLVGFNASQWERIWGISSVRSEQAVDKRQNLDYLVDQCLLSSWVLYLLDNILHWTVVIDMFAGDEPVVDHIGCSLDNNINAGLKYVSDESSDTSLRSLISQKYTNFLYWSFVKEDCSSLVGCGRIYCKHISRICINQDLEEDVVWLNRFCACACIILWKSLIQMVIIVTLSIFHHSYTFFAN